MKDLSCSRPNLSPEVFTEVFTERLQLRPLAVDDAEPLFSIRSIESVHSQLRSGPLASVWEAECWIREVVDRPHSLIFAVSLRDAQGDANSSTIGVIGLNRWDSLFYIFHPDFWGRGYCSEALRTFLNVLFEQQPDREELEAWIFQDNEKSKRVLEKNEFKFRYKIPGQNQREDLWEKEEDELKKAIQALSLPTGPPSAPKNVPSAARRAMWRYVYEPLRS